MFGDINRNEGVLHHDVNLRKMGQRKQDREMQLLLQKASSWFCERSSSSPESYRILSHLMTNCLLSRTWPPSSVFTEESLAALLKPEENSQARVARAFSSRVLFFIPCPFLLLGLVLFASFPNFPFLQFLPFCMNC